MTWIQTYSGKKFSLVDPQPEDVDIVDVIAALGNVVRFAGHCRGAYTVLQHSVHVCDACPDEFRYDGLMHDAPEAYYGDITRPMKDVLSKLFDGQFSRWTEKIDRVVHYALGIPWPVPRPVKHADCVVLATEARDLMGPLLELWRCMPPPLKREIVPLPPQQVYSMFVDRYKKFKP